MSQKNTFHKLAQKAGVSPATVSRIAAGRKSVSPEIQERVRRIADEMGVDLNRKRDEVRRSIAFVLANRDVMHAFQARVLVGAENYVSMHGWDLAFLNLNYAPTLAAKEIYLPPVLTSGLPARGVILAGVNSPNMLEALSFHQIPYSVLGNNMVGAGDDGEIDFDAVYSDDVRGAHDLTKHLIKKGHRDVWYIGNPRLPWFQRCCKGYESAMRDSGLDVHKCEIHSDGHELGYLGAKSILSDQERVTAIFAGSDSVAAGVYAALREYGRSVPGDVSVVGFNDCDAEYLYPNLTTVREYPEELGQHLAEFVLNRVRDPSLPTQRLTIPTQVVVRDSAQAPSKSESSRATTEVAT